MRETLRATSLRMVRHCRRCFGSTSCAPRWLLAAVFGFAGASILAGFASPDANPQPALAFFLFLPLAALVCCVWWALNWMLSLAGMFAVRDGEDAVGAISAAVAFCRERTGPFSRSAPGRDWLTWLRLWELAWLSPCRWALRASCRGDCWCWEWVRDRGVFRGRRLAIHGAAGGICLHCGNAGGIAEAVAARAARAAARRRAADPDHD